MDLDADGHGDEDSTFLVSSLVNGTSTCMLRQLAMRMGPFVVGILECSEVRVSLDVPYRVAVCLALQSLGPGGEICALGHITRCRGH